MSSHGSNGLGSTVSTTGHLIVVVGSSMGAAVERSCTLAVTLELAGEDCHTATTAVTSAHSTANSRNLVVHGLVGMATPGCRFGTPAGSVPSVTSARTVNENLF